MAKQSPSSFFFLLLLPPRICHHLAVTKRKTQQHNNVSSALVICFLFFHLDLIPFGKIARSQLLELCESARGIPSFMQMWFFFPLSLSLESLNSFFFLSQ